MRRPAHVTGLGLWTPGFPSAASYARGLEHPEALAPPCEALPARARRGTSLATRMAVEVATQAAAEAGADLGTTWNVFGSALGEVQTALDQMAMIETAEGVLSPARFKNSVHNTASGLLSIAAGNRGFCTAIAAGPSTLAMCLLEALALLEPGGPDVLVALADEPVAEPFAEGRRYGPLGVGLCLSAEPRPGASLAVVGELARGPAPGERSQLPSALAGNPIAAALPLVDAVLAGRRARVPLELEGEEPWTVELLAGGA